MYISQQALYHNAKLIREKIPERIKMMCVVKADAYGHGSVQAAKMMLRAGADAFAVAIVEEAVELRLSGVNVPILVLGGAGEESLREAVRSDVSQAVFNTDMLDVLQSEAVHIGTRAKAHLKIDTGMSRIGVRDSRELRAILDHWKSKCPDVDMEGIFTHFCAAESDQPFTERQNTRFQRALASVREAGYTPIAHAAATSAMLREEYQYDMVRAGIGLYGTLVPELDGQLSYAQRIACKPLRIETIHAGDTVGYGRTFTAQRDSRIMTVPLGYGDGYPRILGNRADVLVCGKRARIAGNVCMDMLMADITDIPEADMNSEVVLLGRQDGERITPDELADLAGTIPYEIMLGFTPRLIRVYEEDFQNPGGFD